METQIIAKVKKDRVSGFLQSFGLYTADVRLDVFPEVPSNYNAILSILSSSSGFFETTSRKLAELT